MKKLLLTIGSAALISIAGMAQQDTTESNQYRNTRPRPNELRLDSTANPVDSTGIDEDAIQQGEDIRRGTDTTGFEMQRDMEQSNDTLQQQATEQSGDGSESSADQGIEQGEEGANVMTQKSAQQPKESEGQNRNERTAADGSASMDQPASSRTSSSDVEVLESREGPNNEVVYKIQDELYYVDRNEKKLVKVNESELRDTNHKVKIHNGTTSDDDTNKNRKRTKG